MNRVKFVLNMTLVPVYFTLVLIKGIIDAFYVAYQETARGIIVTKESYWD